MKLLMSLITSITIATSYFIPDISQRNTNPRIIDAFILAYDAMYSEDKDLSHHNNIILDMESVYFTDTTHEEREKAIDYFKKYNKQLLNASLFKLQQIGLASDMGQLKLDGVLLMMTEVSADIPDGIIIRGYKWRGPIAAREYKIRLKVIDGNWKVVEVKLLGVA
ncbi:hypothetical protein [Clostridium sp. C8-1-8]|uniref:hypothetical protein n=1 Tax=Clostridium sp. C8-1-8 TaxID=2698831 RepID=UPI00136F9E6D|nr:hypothetical protein [Clostridium sp. C8-1-8]